MTSPKRQPKRYDYVEAIRLTYMPAPRLGVSKEAAKRLTDAMAKRAARKLVREAVSMAVGPHAPTADAIAKELVR